MRVVAPLAAFVVAVAPACTPPGPSGGAPTARLAADVLAGQAPLDVVLDASASEPFVDGDALTFRFDVDGDGTFDGEAGGDSSASHRFATAGVYHPRVQVIGPDGDSDEASVDIEVVGEDPRQPLVADIDVDTNRDGALTSADEIDEDRFDAAGGAVLLANVDDDDGDGERDSRDDVPPTDADLDDTTEVLVHKVVELGDHTVELSLAPAAALTRLRLWRDDDGALSVLLDPNAPQATTTLDDAGAGDLRLVLEALVPRTVEWDGSVTLTLTVRDAAGAAVSTDAVALRAAPVILPDNLQPPRRVFVVDIRGGGDENSAFVSAMQSSLDATRTSLERLDGGEYSDDRWVQDNMELGYQTRPGAGGDVVEMKTAIQLQRDYGGQGLDAFVPFAWLGADQGFLYPGGDPSKHNYGGNLEVAPPVDGFPFGRLLYGGGDGGTLLGRPSSDTMNPTQLGFLEAQQVQAPAVELSSEWLAVGHIDEIFQFVPDLTPGERGFVVVIASPDVANQALLALADAGRGDAVVFEGQDQSYTVDEVLGAENFQALNEAAQVRIDGVQAGLSAALGLTDDDFRHVPVLYDDEGGGLVAAFNPGVQNLVTAGDRLFVPDPSGPHDAQGHDVWQEATRAALADTDLDVVFVDVFRSYHQLMGEAHCGTNVDREPYSTAWWTR